MNFKISWNEKLKNFLRLNGLKVKGKKKNFLQKILSQWTNKVPVLASAARIEEELAKD